MRVGFKTPSLLSSSTYSWFLLMQYQQTMADLGMISEEIEANKGSNCDMKSKSESLEKWVRAGEGIANAMQSAMLKMKRHHD